MRPYLRAANVTWQGICVDDVKTMNFDDVDFAKYKLEAGDILLNEASGSPHEVGKPAIWRSEVEDCCFQNTLLRLRPQLVDRNYVYWYCYSSALTGRLGEAGRGVNIRHLGKRGLAQFRIPVAPLAEQERIVAAIEEHFSHLDAADDSLVTTQSKVRDLRAVLAKSATRDWPAAELGDLADVFVGSTPSRKKPELWGGPVPWVSSGEIQFCRIGGTRESVATAAVRPDRIHPPGTVLLGMIGEGRTRGQAAVLEIPAAHNQNSAAIRTQPSRLDPNWLFYVFSAQYESNRRVGSGNNQPALNKARVQGLRIPLPPLREQRRLVEQLDEAAAVLDQLRSGLEGALQRCAALRRAVLSEAFAGRLVPQDPNDEPASVLLERIAASRTTEPSR